MEKFFIVLSIITFFGGIIGFWMSVGWLLDKLWDL